MVSHSLCEQWNCFARILSRSEIGDEKNVLDPVDHCLKRRKIVDLLVFFSGLENVGIIKT